jgi:hypothetical protein
VKWKYNRQKKQNDSEVISTSDGRYRHCYTVGRLNGKFSLVLFSWEIGPFKWGGRKHIGDFKKLSGAKKVAEVYEEETK